MRDLNEEFDDYKKHIAALEAKLSAAREESDTLIKENAGLKGELIVVEAENERLKSECLDFENREGAICPEDVGFEEYIRHLQKRVEELEDRIRVSMPYSCDRR